MPSRPLRAAPPPPADDDVAGEHATGTATISRAHGRGRPAGGGAATEVRRPPRSRTKKKPAPQAPLTLPPAVVIAAAPVPAWRQSLKRALDVVGSIVGLVLSVPLLLVLAAAVKLASPGPVVFAQQRIGRHGRRFTCYKLRTMCADAESRLAGDAQLHAAYVANDFKLPACEDPRLTRLGRFLRTTSLDELPQFWNVLRGDMSLVGPRPIVEAELEHYGAAREVLLAVKPGLTGAWAVEGRSRINYPERADIELAYATGWTIGGDLQILARTVGVVLQRRGAY
jgi:lipopolysaccharide/colanic/teichoic acid biosynthesis glycosyltransferase